MGKVGPGQLGAMKQSWAVQRDFLRLGDDTRGGKGAAHGIWGHCFKGEVGLEGGLEAEGLAIESPSQSSRRGFWCRVGREIRRLSQLP